MSNPYTRRADILRKLYRLVARHTSPQNPNPPIPDLTATYLSNETAWEECERQIRQSSVACGIPFADFDVVLRESNAAFRELLHVSAGEVPNPALLVPKYMKIESRLRELAMTYGGQMNPDEGKDPKPKPKGRPKRSEKREARQKEIAEKWQHFYESKSWNDQDGTPKEQFCKQEGINWEELDTALRRDRERRRKKKAAQKQKKGGAK
jgi:hypothetical protein